MRFLPLDLDLYEQYEIPQGYEAYLLEVENITSDRADEIEMDYQSQGYKIFHVDMTKNKSEGYFLKIIVAKNSFTF